MTGLAPAPASGPAPALVIHAPHTTPRLWPSFHIHLNLLLGSTLRSLHTHLPLLPSLLPSPFPLTLSPAPSHPRSLKSSALHRRRGRPLTSDPLRAPRTPRSRWPTSSTTPGAIAPLPPPTTPRNLKVRVKLTLTIPSPTTPTSNTKAAQLNSNPEAGATISMWSTAAPLLPSKVSIMRMAPTMLLSSTQTFPKQLKQMETLKLSGSLTSLL